MVLWFANDDCKIRLFIKNYIRESLKEIKLLKGDNLEHSEILCNIFMQFHIFNIRLKLYYF